MSSSPTMPVGASLTRAEMWGEPFFGFGVQRRPRCLIPSGAAYWVPRRVVDRVADLVVIANGVECLVLGAGSALHQLRVEHCFFRGGVQVE